MPGFTLIELAIVLVIVAALATMAISVTRAGKPRAEVSQLALDIRGLLASARAEALSTGHDVAVMVFPDLDTPSGGRGRIIVYSDGDRGLFDATSAINFDNYDPNRTETGAQSEFLAILDLPAFYVFGPALGQAPKVLAAPYAGLPVDADCTFCLGNGVGGRRGAIVFNHQGAARFQSACGPPSGVLANTLGGSLSLQSTVAGGEIRTIAVVAATGSLRAIQTKL